MTVLEVAVLSVPLRRRFDYLPPADCDPALLRPGVRLRLNFGRRQQVGILLQIKESSDIAPQRLKSIIGIIDEQPLLPELIHRLLLQSAHYYHHPLGEVYETALPLWLRQGRAAVPTPQHHYCITESGRAQDLVALKRAPRQRQLLQQLQQGALTGDALKAITPSWRDAIKRLTEKGWVTVEACEPAEPSGPLEPPHPLNPEQQQAVDGIIRESEAEQPQPILLDGVTGSGKTEVYLQVIEAITSRGKQALVLVPEISLTPQTVARFRNRFGAAIALLHSGRSHGERFNAWLAARNGTARIVIGTRSALFTPLKRPGIIIVDEEHDLSFKQQEGFRYSARDLAVLRGKLEQVPVVLGSATPSLESLHNVQCGKYRPFHLTRRAGNAKPPQLSLIDLRSRKVENLLSTPLLERVNHHLQQQGQVLLFLNRRGYAPVLLCHQCGWSALCPRCEIHYVYHQKRGRLICHHCGGERRFPDHCPECNSTQLKQIGTGTERIEELLQHHFPDHSISRIDRDTTRGKEAMAEKLEQIHAGTHQLLLGTQMLAKGHHFPDVTLVAILDTDGGFFGSDFRAIEQMGQLIIQVAGRAGRGEQSGEVVMQTHNPDHPLLTTLLRDGYPTFAQQALAERRQAQLPPFSHLTLIRSEAAQAEHARNFLQETARLAGELSERSVEILGPVPSPMEKRAGRYRYQLLLQSSQREPLHRLLVPLASAIEGLKSARQARWSIDVDPMELL